MARWTIAETEKLRLLKTLGKSMERILQEFPHRNKRQIDFKLENMQLVIPKPRVVKDENKPIKVTSVAWGDVMENSVDNIRIAAGAVKGNNGEFYKDGKRISIGEMAQIARGV